MLTYPRRLNEHTSLWKRASANSKGSEQWSSKMGIWLNFTQFLNFVPQSADHHWKCNHRVLHHDHRWLKRPSFHGLTSIATELTATSALQSILQNPTIPRNPMQQQAIACNQSLKTRDANNRQWLPHDSREKSWKFFDWLIPDRRAPGKLAMTEWRFTLGLPSSSEPGIKPLCSQSDLA